MAIQSLTDITVDSGRPQYEKFDIDKNDKVRILIPKLDVAVEYVHVFHNDAPVMETNDRGKQVPRWSRDSFAGMFICLGDQDVVKRNTRYGDPANCPACRRMNDENARLIETPRKTFAMNVVQYQTASGDNLKFRNKNVEVKVWRHADVKKVETLLDIARQVDKKIHTVDILITADNTEWKKLTITPAVDGAAYMKDATLKKNVAAAVKEELYPPEILTAACGKPVTEEEMETELKMVYQSYNGAGASSSASSSSNGSSPAVAQEETVTIGDSQDVESLIVLDGDESTEVEGIELDSLASLLE